MAIRSFKDYLDKKQRDAITQLEVIQRILEKNGLRVKDFLKEEGTEDPYIFCYNPQPTQFKGVRVYKIGNNLAFRVQNEDKTQPYGTAYPVDIESMFADYMSDEDIDEKKAGERVIETVSEQLKKFFEKSTAAEKEELMHKGGGEPSSAIMRSTGTDYSTLIYNKGS